MQMTSPPPNPPAPTDDAPDDTRRYHLGNAAWIVGGLAFLCMLGYLVATPGSPPPKNALWAIGSVVLLANTVMSIRRSFRKPKSDAVLIAEPVRWADERQINLHLKASAVAGISMYGFAVALLLMGGVGAAADITISGPDRWVDLSMGVAFAFIAVYSVALRVAARYYSRKG